MGLPTGQGRWLAGLLGKGAGWPAGKGSPREEQRFGGSGVSGGAGLRREQRFGGSNVLEGAMLTKEKFVFILVYALSLEGVFWEGVLESLQENQTRPYTESAVGETRNQFKYSNSFLNRK